MIGGGLTVSTIGPVGWAIYQEVSGEFSITEDIYLEAMEKHGGGR